MDFNSCGYAHKSSDTDLCQVASPFSSIFHYLIFPRLRVGTVDGQHKRCREREVALHLDHTYLVNVCFYICLFIDEEVVLYRQRGRWHNASALIVHGAFEHNAAHSATASKRASRPEVYQSLNCAVYLQRTFRDNHLALRATLALQDESALLRFPDVSLSAHIGSKCHRLSLDRHGIDSART